MEVYKAKYVKKHVVYGAIEKERRYQDKKWGTIEENPLSLEEWLAIMQGELSEAIDAFYDETKEDVLAEIIQVVAVGHACLEQHGIVHFRRITTPATRRGSRRKYGIFRRRHRTRHITTDRR